MIAAALFVGCHYFVDLLAGSIVAGAGVLLVDRIYPRLTREADALRGRWALHHGRGGWARA
jgi:membrane-associated phospholipid phosphatase